MIDWCLSGIKLLNYGASIPHKLASRLYKIKNKIFQFERNMKQKELKLMKTDKQIMMESLENILTEYADDEITWEYEGVTYSAQELLQSLKDGSRLGNQFWSCFCGELEHFFVKFKAS